MAEANAPPLRRGILAIGNLLVDKLHRIPAYPSESLLAIISESAASPGGGVFNVLGDLARVDPALPLAVAGVIGDDADGQFIRSCFEGMNVDTGALRVVTDAPTSFTHVMISEANASRTFFHAHGANRRLGLDAFAGLPSRVRIAHLAYLLLLEGLDRPDPDYGSEGAHALAILRGKGFVTSLDLVSDGDPERYRRFVRPALPYTDYLIINDVEAAHLTGLPQLAAGDGVDWDAAIEQASALMSAGVSRLAAIHFPEGAVAVAKDGQAYRQPSYPVAKDEKVSALGAGDAFCAGMLYGLHEERSLPDCLRLGVALAHFNLKAASATGGAMPLGRLEALIARRETGQI